VEKLERSQSSRSSARLAARGSACKVWTGVRTITPSHVCTGPSAGGVRRPQPAAGRAGASGPSEGVHGSPARLVGRWWAAPDATRGRAGSVRQPCGRNVEQQGGGGTRGRGPARAAPGQGAGPQR
jgi:hypothetical protein